MNYKARFTDRIPQLIQFTQLETERHSSPHHHPTLHSCVVAFSLWLSCFGHRMFLLCFCSKQKLRRFSKVDYCAFSFSLCKAWSSYLQHQGNQCWWMTSNGFFIQVLTGKKVPIISSATSLYHSDRTRPFHTSLLSPWNRVLCFSLFLRWKKNEK